MNKDMRPTCPKCGKKMETSHGRVPATHLSMFPWSGHTIRNKTKLREIYTCTGCGTTYYQSKALIEFKEMKIIETHL